MKLKFSSFSVPNRAKLDLVVTILMLSIAVVFVAVAARSYLQRPRNVAVELPVPSQPVSLQGAMIAGCPSAAAAVIVYADFQCPACGQLARDTLPLIRQRYVDTCKVLLAFRNLPVASTHPFAVGAAEAAACAARQSRFWPMHDLLYKEQDRLDRTGLNEKARRAGLDEAGFNACMDDGEVLSEIRQDAGEGVTLGVSSTPALFFGIIERDGKVKVMRRVGGALRVGEFQEILDGLLRQIPTTVTGR